MTSTLLVRLPSQAERADSPPIEEVLCALAEGGTPLFPKAGGALRLGASASVGLGVDDAR
jgi:hypothetical protein